MAFTFEDLIDSLRASRSGFHKHLEGLRDDQWDWKPYPECKSIRETLIHLVVDDRVAVAALDSTEDPDYEGLVNTATAEAGRDITEFLIERSARLDIFAAAMLGQLEVVKTILQAYPALATAPGPHGIPLLRHATAGGEAAAPVAEYLQSLH